MKRSLWRAAAALALSALSAGAALAQTLATWNEPNEARFSIQRPANWPVDAMSDSSPAVRRYAAGLADAECNIYAIRRESSAARSAADVRTSFAAPLSAAQWASVASSIRSLRTAGPAEAITVDTSRFFPIQRATFPSGGATIHAGLHARPGLEIWVFCQSFDNRDRTSVFESVIRSVSTPRDAQDRAAIEASAAPAPAPTPAAQ